MHTREGKSRNKDKRHKQVVLKQLPPSARPRFFKQSINCCWVVSLSGSVEIGKIFSGVPRKNRNGNCGGAAAGLVAERLCRQAVTFGAQPWRKYPQNLGWLQHLAHSRGHVGSCPATNRVAEFLVFRIVLGYKVLLLGICGVYGRKKQGRRRTFLRPKSLSLGPRFFESLARSPLWGFHPMKGKPLHKKAALSAFTLKIHKHRCNTLQINRGCQKKVLNQSMSAFG